MFEKTTTGDYEATGENAQFTLRLQDGEFFIVVSIGSRKNVILEVRREGVNLDDFTVKALDRASKIFLVVQTLLPYVRNATRMMSIFRSLGYPQDKVEVLVNRFWKNDEIGLEQLRSSLGMDKLHTIPNGYKEVAKAINLGVPLASVSKSCLVYQAIFQLSESLHKKAAEPHGSLLSRLLSR